MADLSVPVLLLMMLAAACVTPTSSSTSFLGVIGAGELICGAPGYDVSNLTRADYWQFTHTGQCLGDSSMCTYMMTFCKPLLVPYANCTNASVCQQSESRNVTVLGAYTANPFHVDHVTNGFVATFPNGSTYTTSDGKPCNTSVLINLECNSTALWIPTIKKDVIMPSIVPVPVEVLYQPSNCVYIIKFSYAGACHKLTPADVVSVLSPGSVMLIIFFVSLAVYFLCGIIVNLLRGERGVSILPNSEFWRMLPDWIKAGCEFTFQCQCVKESGSSYDSI